MSGINDCPKCGQRIVWSSSGSEYYGHTCDRETVIQYNHEVSEANKCGLVLSSYRHQMYMHNTYGDPKPEYLPAPDK